MRHRFKGMQDKSENVGGMWDYTNLMVEYWIRILWWEWDLLSLTGGMWVVLKVTM